MSRRFYLPPNTTSRKSRDLRFNVWWLFAVISVGLILLVGYLWFDKPVPSVTAEPPVRRSLDSVHAVAQDISTAAVSPADTAAPIAATEPESRDTTAQVRRPLVENPIRIQLLNGTKTKGLARTASLALRQMGFDVREVGNAGHFGYTKSQVIDRTGSEKLAQTVADSIGVTADNVLSAVESRLVDIDVTFVIGADFKTLRVFR